MARGHDDASDGDDGPILSPDELDISDDEHVAEIDEGRYVVSPNEPIGDVPGPDAGRTDESGGSVPRGPPEVDRPSREGGSAGSAPPQANAGPGSGPPPVTESAVRDWLAEQFDETDSRYGFDVTATFDGTVEHRQMVSNDVVTIFESLVLWYAQQIDSTTPVEEVLGLLLMEANVPVRYPAASLRHLVESTDLGPDDSIADLVRAVDDDGFRI